MVILGLWQTLNLVSFISGLLAAQRRLRRQARLPQFDSAHRPPYDFASFDFRSGR
jgi:hypothetical protein